MSMPELFSVSTMFAIASGHAEQTTERALGVTSPADDREPLDLAEQRSPISDVCSREFARYAVIYVGWGVGVLSRGSEKAA
jgi:hypothetical protein